MRHGSLFNGIGGFMLAAAWLGWDNVFYCENDSFCNSVTRKHFNKSNQHGNIETEKFTEYFGKIDIVSGGDPCQPHSKSGKRLGFADPRYLWPQKFRAIREIRPSWVVNENVRGSINTGLLDQKISDLENEGYTCWPPLLVPSCAQAIHERYRVWLVAYSYENADSNHAGKIQSEAGKVEDKKQGENREWMRPVPGSILTDENWQEVASRLCRSIDGLSNRVDRNGAIGNAIDPFIAYEIFKAIEETENNQ